MLVLSHDGQPRLYGAECGTGASVFGAGHRDAQGAEGDSGFQKTHAAHCDLEEDDRWVFTADQTKPQMAVIDTKTERVAKWIPIEADGYGGAVTPDGRWFLVALPDVNKVAVIGMCRPCK